MGALTLSGVSGQVAGPCFLNEITGGTIVLYAHPGHRTPTPLLADRRSDSVAGDSRRVSAGESSARRTRTGQAIRRLSAVHAGSADRLEVEGYVDVRPGSGIMVTTPKSEAPDCSGDEGPLEILRVRSLIEGAIAAEVARDIEPKDIAALEEILRAMEAETTAPGRLAADRQFHHCITAKLENKVLLRLLTGLLEQSDRPWARQFAIHFDNAETWAAVFAEHRKIVAALAARDPEQAREAMCQHLQKAHDRWALEPDRDAETGFDDGHSGC